MVKGQINHDVLDTLLHSDWLKRLLKCVKQVNQHDSNMLNQPDSIQEVNFSYGISARFEA